MSSWVVDDRWFQLGDCCFMFHSQLAIRVFFYWPEIALPCPLSPLSFSCLPFLLSLPLPSCAVSRHAAQSHPALLGVRISRAPFISVRPRDFCRRAVPDPAQMNECCLSQSFLSGWVFSLHIYVCSTCMQYPVERILDSWN